MLITLNINNAIFCINHVNDSECRTKVFLKNKNTKHVQKGMTTLVEYTYVTMIFNQSQ